MSIIGSVSLTDKKGVFLGSVNLDNLNISPNQIAYSTDGTNLSGITPSTGLTLIGSALETRGNPDIQLTANSLYVNDNKSSIQSAVNASTQADVIYVSSGSYGEAQITSTNKLNIAIMGPPVGTVANTICEVLNGFSLTGTSDLIRIANIQIKGASSEFSGLGRTKLSNCVFTGTALQTNAITFGAGSTKFITVVDCEFDQYCTITVPNTFASAIYFINCGFNGATITLNNANNLQVIFNNCSGFTAFPSTAKATFVGLNVLTSGASQVNTTDLKTTLINGAAPLSAANQATTLIPFCTATSNALSCDADFNFTTATNTLAVPNITVTNINGSAYPPASSGVSVSNQSTTLVPFCTATSNALSCDADFNFTTATNTLAVPNITVTNINGSAYPPASSGVSVSNQSIGLVPICTATNNSLTTDTNLSFDTGTDTLIAQNITSNNNITTSFINNQYPTTISEQFENGIAVSVANQNSLYNYTGFEYIQSTQTLNVPNISVTNINGAPYSGGGSLSGLTKFKYYLKQNLTNQTGQTLSYSTASLTLDTTKFYIVNVSYSFDAVSGNSIQTISAAIRNDDGDTYEDAQFSAITNQQLINLNFYFQPTKSVSPLTFIISGPDHNIENTVNDIIIWTVMEIQ